MPELYHPVSGTTLDVSEGDLDWYESNGWVSTEPYEFKDNSFDAVYPDAFTAQSEADESAQAEAKANANASSTPAASPKAAGVKADGGPSA